MKLTAEILSRDEQQRIHDHSLRVLWEAGVQFHSLKALKLLAEAGATVDWETKIARIPEKLVIQTLETAPKSFVLGARNSSYDYPMPSPHTRYTMDGTSAFATDFETGERRYGTLKDLERGVRVFMAADMGVMCWPPCCASDAPDGSRPLHEFLTMLRFCSKHGNHELHHPNQVPYFVAALKAICGDDDAVRQRKIASVVYCPVAPLMHDAEMCDAYLDLGAYDVPILILPMPATGTTGPASLFSNIVQGNAEALSSIVLYQLARPGRPLIYGSASGSLDFASGGFLTGVPEMVLQTAAMAVMGRFYGLPNTATGCVSDAKATGIQAVIEKVITTLPAVLVSADLVSGIGEIETSQNLILEQVLIDNEIAHFCERLHQGVDTSPQKDLIEDIIHVGPGGNFLKARSTRVMARSDEFYIPQLAVRQSYENWLALGSPDMRDRAREKVREILNSPLVDPLPEVVSREIDEILREADKELSAEE
ncbi:MAG: hypothetical protein HPY45_00995 [Anaerolineae bacterium]|nr:hypothetical protein [Anaerolineae bacterium]